MSNRKTEINQRAAERKSMLSVSFLVEGLTGAAGLLTRDA
jgi:hypothetical protein